MGGTHMQRLKSRDGPQLTDSYLANQLSHHRTWVKSVYSETSKFVHFTEKQIFAGLTEVNDEERSFEMLFATNDAHVPERIFLEAVEGFNAATLLLGEVITSWQETKSQLIPPDAV